MLLLPEVARPDDSAEVAQKVLETFREPFLVEGHRLRTTASIGVIVYPDDGEDADALMKNADTAMYHAKYRGRNTYQRYSSVMMTKLPE